MGSIAVAYAKDLHGRYLTYWPNWMPTRDVKLGDCGTLDRGVLFEPQRPARKFGVSSEALKARRVDRESLLEFTSKRSVRFELQAEAASVVPIHGIPPGHVGGHITFARANQTALMAVRVREREIEDKLLLGQELKELAERGVFPPEYVVVTGVVIARSGRVFVSTDRSQSVTLRAEAGIGPGPIQLASLGGAFTADVGSGGLMSFDGTSGMTPLLKLMGFSAGGKLRHWQRTHISRSRHVPRIIVEPLGKAATIGQALTVRPVDGQRLAIAPVGHRPFVTAAAGFDVLRVAPVLTDSESLSSVAPRESLGPRPDMVLGGQEGIFFGAVDDAPQLGVTLEFRPFDGSSVVIEPVDAAPFLAKIAGGETLSFDPAVLDFSSSAQLPSGLASLGDDDLVLEEVDFDAELASAEA
jgi:hypothetical protein